MADRHTEEVNQLFDRLRPGIFTPKPVVDTNQAGILPEGWARIEDAESNEIAAIGRQVYRPAPVGIAHNTWTKVATYSSTPITGVGTTYNAYGGGEIRTDVAGVYMITVHADFAASLGGARRIIGVSFNLAATPTAAPLETNWESRTPSTEPIHLNATWIVPMAVNQTVALFLYQNSGGPLNSEDAVLSIFRLGT